MNSTYNKKGFTLVELIIATSLLAMIMTSVITLLVNFMRNYGKSESSGILLQDSALFLAHLRTDLNNSVVEGDVNSISDAKRIICIDDKILHFPVYDSSIGRINHISYEIEETRNGYVIVRKTDKGNSKKIANNIATITWELNYETIPTKPVATKRLSVFVDVEFAMKKENSGANFKIKTNIFPARLNRQIN